MTLSKLVWNSFVFGYGTLVLPAFLLLAFIRKPNFRRLNAEDKKELVAARERLWNLERQPFGLHHRFCVLRCGAKLHYVESIQREQTSTSNLVIFMHGYPDSYALWKRYLQNPRLATRATLIAVDLPGFGGSDSMDRYGPAEVMEAITEFILKMREKYVSDDNSSSSSSSSRVVVVAHDWGAMVGFRLAAEAPQLADHFILGNCIHPPLAVSNVKTRLASAGQMVRTWLRSPLKVRLLRRAFRNITPLLRQLVKSGYVFVFNLPFPMANLIGHVGDYWWFRYLNAVSTHPDPPKPLSGVHGAELLAGSVGPSLRECPTALKDSELTYSDSVRRRARTGGFQDKISFYRHGLAFAPWEKSLEALWELDQLQQRKGRQRSASCAAIFDTGPEGSLQAPTTVIWGKGDVAIENAIALEGFRDYFGVKNSQVVVVSDCGHWSPLEKQGAPIFENAIEWAVEGGKVSLRNKLGNNYPMAQITSER
ncbi:uncharacterized protein PV09_07277 [Verruconis gallopava]|uniref:AB hydrolase-1 domain-containing protein n=1 Tax=Verruconis gallopava TaxID=253628 RepID=A0A0D2APZ1_9PEZI|nr:uncharacterized protein PV09_07277 [Verruconis gallopava]KIW01234.1 hypothetical protein PV09_07277 [Verruconis gallopava]